MAGAGRPWRGAVAWWLWLVMGGVLAALELLGDAAFYLIFLGAAAALVGLLELAGAGLPMWAQWLVFAVSSVVSMVLFRQKLYDRVRGGLPGFDNTSDDEVVEVTEDVPARGRTRVALRGSQWTATNVGSSAIAAGAQARVVGSAGTRLRIEAMLTHAEDQTEDTPKAPSET